MKTAEILNSINKNIPKQTNRGKVLFTQSFSIYEPCFVHDRLMAYSLMLRGFDIYATFCDGIQENECNVYGGVWGGGETFNKNCQTCQEKSQDLWSILDEENIYKYSSYLEKQDYIDIENKLIAVPYNKWKDYHEDDFNYGLWSKDILVNNYVVADYKLIENHEILGRSHLKNLLLLKIAYERIIKVNKPNRIISNDSYYGMWKMWELLAVENNIPFYSHWSGTRKGGWCYAYNDASMNLDFSKIWETYSSISLTKEEDERVEQWLQNRTLGNDMILNTATLLDYQNETADFSKFHKNKPTATLFTNVAWDLAALNKEIFTKNISEWIIETIKWFSEHQEFQLIIKTHPAEANPTIPATKETIESVIKKVFVKLPNNIFFLSPKASITVYDLFKITTVGIVYTTTVAMEMAARGIPIITAGKSHYRGYGFTIDPSTISEYFTSLKSILKDPNESDSKETINLAKKFIKFNFFHYYSKIGLFEFEWKKPINILISSSKDLKKGNHQHWDYIIDKIEKGEPILDSKEWPKES
ncbi:hypothetical protein [Arcobacter sp. F2176]|uniref:hypothetical protein n=1 Tax=Arcobacter sp. F2176 TaxID=2044511 RepID=UPI00100BDDD6|nr:hypothetical protein [Arcobacter sp. F2176]RXJ82209.1 hypothetical protein CRU95_01765 [Arcobacter sp. F2176]